MLRLDRQTAEFDGWIVLWLRVLPSLPFTLLNLLCGLTRISFFPFALATLIGIVPGTLTYGWAADRMLRLGESSDGLRPQLRPTLLALLLLALLPIAGWQAKRHGWADLLAARHRKRP